MGLRDSKSMDAASTPVVAIGTLRRSVGRAGVGQSYDGLSGNRCDGVEVLVDVQDG